MKRLARCASGRCRVWSRVGINRSLWSRLCLEWSRLCFGVLLFAVAAQAEVKRVVILKVDGLPPRLVERYAGESAGGGRAGRSRLPWIQHVFGQNGVWLENFYTRGLSLSAPSWSLLDTGRPLEIRGNAEYDRYTLRVRDYLNFFPFYLSYAMSKRVDMAGVELLDETGARLLIDRFPEEQRYQSFQLLQRGVRWQTLQSSLKSKFSRSIKELFDEWQIGFSMASSINQQTERELIEKLKDPQVRYLDYFTGDYDHVAHLAADRGTQLHTIEAIDALVGRVWSAIEASPLADSTLLVLVSDHGMNTSEGVYSQGYNLIDWFSSAAGGGHHVLTNRHPMTEFKLKGLDPFVSEVITPSTESSYLAGESDRYPTAVLDLDGNERASISLRSNALNQLHVLLDYLVRKRPPGALRHAVLETFFEIRDREAVVWRKQLEELEDDLGDLRGRIKEQQRVIDAQPKKWSAEERNRGLDKDARREGVRLEAMKSDERAYGEYASAMTRLLALDPADFDPGKFKMDELIPRKSLGEANSIRDLQHYAAGPAAGGLVIGEGGKLDVERSFRYVDYFAALGSIAVKNNVQKAVGSRPVDFVAVPLASSQLVWLWSSEDRQALIHARRAEPGGLELRYEPVARLKQDASGDLHYESLAGGAGFPLELFEDPNLGVPPAERAAWLTEWHTEREWLNAVHRTKYSNGIIGVVEAMLSGPREGDRFENRKRRLRLPDFVIFARDHWNFNVRGFNPGGNHGSFLRVSTHSVLMLAGGAATGVPRGVRVATPYDSLSFVPTILSLMGMPDASLPGAVIVEAGN